MNNSSHAISITAVTVVRDGLFYTTTIKDTHKSHIKSSGLNVNGYLIYIIPIAE